MCVWKRMFLLMCNRWKKAFTFTFIPLAARIYIIYSVQYQTKYSMQAALIRDKYKKILQEPEEEDSQDQWEVAYAQMAKNRKKKILTEHSSNQSVNNQNPDASKELYNVKQKLAQCLSNCKLHCQQIQRLKKEHMMFEDQRQQWKESQSEFNRKFEEEKNNTNLHLQKIKQLQNELQDVNMKYQQIFVERDLQQKQTEFYKNELSQLKDQIQRKQKQFKCFEKQFKLFQKFKKENQYLKTDVQRLTSLIQDSVKNGRICGDMLKKHFLGKPHRQMDFWYPQQLVGEVQHFLKKSQVGYGNKQFTANLVKFIEKISQKSTKEETKTRQGLSCSKQKDSQSLKKTSKLNIFELSNKKHSCNIGSLRQDYLLRSNTNSFWKSNESRILSTGYTSAGLGYATIKSQCWDVINEFRTIVFELLLEKEVKRKKIKRLLDSMINTIMQLFDSNSPNKDFGYPHVQRNEFSNIRLSTEQTHLK